VPSLPPRPAGGQDRWGRDPGGERGPPRHGLREHRQHEDGLHVTTTTTTDASAHSRIDSAGTA
jgi:hypothetical protein